MTLKELYESKMVKGAPKVERVARPVVTRNTVPVSQITISSGGKALLLPKSRVHCGYATSTEDDVNLTVVAETVDKQGSASVLIKKKNGLTKLDIDFINKLIPCVVSLTSEKECLLTLQLSIGEVDVAITEDKSDAVPIKGDES